MSKNNKYEFRAIHKKTTRENRNFKTFAKRDPKNAKKRRFSIMTQVSEIFEDLKLAKSLNNIKAFEILDENLRQNMSRFKNLYEGLYSYYKDQSIIEKMILDKVIICAVLEIKRVWAKGSRSEPLRDKLIELGKESKNNFEIFPDSNVTDQLLEAIN